MSRVVAPILLALFALPAAPAAAAPARTFDLVTFTPPDGFTLDDSAKDHVALTRTSRDSYCVIGIYGAADARADLDASFAAEWSDVVTRSVDPVAVPQNQHAAIAGSQAAVGAAASTISGKPVIAMLATIDAGAKVVSVVVLAPSQDAFKACQPSITSLLNGLAVRRVGAAQPPATSAPAPAPAPVPSPASDGKVPPAPSTLSIADLAGDWKHDDGALTQYASVSTGQYAGFDSIQTRESWSIDAKKSIAMWSFYGVQAGNGGVREITSNRPFKITLSGDGELVLTPADGKYVENVEHFLVRGWGVGPDATLLVINGPYFSGGIPDQARQDPSYNHYQNQVWVRKNARAK